MGRFIEVVDADATWSAAFEREAKVLVRVFGEALIDIHHIGSTAVPALPAKPVIDILVVLTETGTIERFSAAMEARGYRVRGECLDAKVPGTPGRFYFSKDADGVRTHQVHACAAGHLEVADKLVFRDYLREHPQQAAAYGALKRRLALDYPHDIVNYIRGKELFIKSLLEDARSWRRVSDTQPVDAAHVSQAQFEEPNRMKRIVHVLGTAARVAVSLLAVAIALYAVCFLIFRETMFPPPLAASLHTRPWGIYPHVLFGSIALAFGSVQFWRNLPFSHPALHRALGKVYVVAALGTGIAGLYMSFFAYGGAVTQFGFGLLAISVLTATSIAYQQIRRRKIAAHRRWMLRSFALIFAAVTLRIELPILTGVFQAFAPAYAMVAWLCWVPNLAITEVYIRTAVEGRAR